MASQLYDSFKQGLLNKEFDLDTDVIKVALVDRTVDEPTVTGTDTLITDITQYAGTTAQTISSPTITNGVFDSAGTPTFTAVTQSASKTVGALVIYHDTSSKLIAWVEVTPVTPNGGDITVTWGANIFAL